MTTAPVILSAHQYPDITCVCRLVRITATCDVCGAVVDAIHMPECTHGFYCAAHCPCRTYRPSEDELRAMDYNRRMLEERQRKGSGPKPRHVRAGGVPPLVNPARRAAALRQWSDPAARRKIVADIRRGKRAR